MAEAVRVVARIRPPVVREEGQEQVVSASGNTIFVASGIGKQVPYRFDAVLSPSSTQADVFEHVQPLVQSALAGYNCTVFAYGQTGTGKTHTMLGLDMWQLAVSGTSVSSVLEALPSTSLGIIPSAMSYLFQQLDAKADRTPPRVWASYVEIYNERVFDLLSGGAQERTSGGLDIRQDKALGVFIQDVAEVSVETVEDVLSVLWQGARNRAISATDMNEYSSRSHTIFTVIVEQTPSAASSDAADGAKLTIRSKINLVDLAGSEKIRPHQISGISDRRLAELTAINQSLSCLGNCIRALSEPDRVHIPYRDSKLTRLLQDSLGGNTKTAFIVTLSPAADATEETISTLQFADRAKKVVVHATVNETLDDPSLLRQYQHEIANLKKQLRALAASGGSSAADGAPDTSTLVAELRAELSKSKEEHVSVLQTLSRTREELLIVKQERSELVKILSASLMKDKDDLQAQGDRDRELMVDAQSKALDARAARILEWDKIILEAKAAIEKQSQALQPIFHAASGLDSLDDDLSMAVKSQLQLLELQVSTHKDELLRCKTAFLADTARLQEELGHRIAEVEELYVKTRSVAAPSASSTPVAPSKWTHHVDAELKRSYYYCKATGESTWDRPADFAWTGSEIEQKLLKLLPDLSTTLDTGVKSTVQTTSASITEITAGLLGKPELALARDAIRGLYESTLKAIVDNSQQLRVTQESAVSLFAAEVGLR